MSLNLNRELYVSKVVPLDKSIQGWKDIYSYAKNYPLPSYHDKSLSYSSFGFLITTDAKLKPISGWQVLSSELWANCRKRYRSDLVKNILTQQIRKKEGILKIGNDWSYFKEEVEETNGGVSVIHHCLSAWYVEVGDIDGIAYDFVRKVRSATSIQDELNSGIFPHGEGGRFSDVMVTVDSGKKEYSSGLLKSINDSSNLNMKFEGSVDTIREYDERKGFIYTDEEAENTCIVYVKQGKKEWPYAASRVYRVLRIEDWQGKLKDSVKELLRLTPTDYHSHLQKGLKLLRGLKFGGNPIQFDYSTDVEWDVRIADTSQACSLVNSQTGSKLLFNDSWKHHIGKNPIQPYPLIKITYCVHEDDLWALPTCKLYNESVMSIVPAWANEASEFTLILKGDTQTEIKQSIQAGLDELAKIPGQHLVVSALRPSRPGIDIYTWLKRKLTECDYKHQNYKIFASGRFNAPNQRSTHDMNICQLLLKFGRLPVPFSIDIGFIDIVVGVDIGRSGRNRSRPAMAVSIDRLGNTYGGSVSSEPQPGEEMSNRTIRDLLDNQINRYKAKAGVLPTRVLILRDGNSSNQELTDMNEICEEWTKLGVEVSWITVQKSGAPRLLEYDGKEVIDKLPESQSYLIASKNSAWCWTTGGSVGRFPGIPIAFSFRVERNFKTDPLSMDEWCRVLIAQAKTSQVNPYNNTRLPFTLHLSDNMAKALIRGAIPPDYSGDGFPAC